MNPDTDMDGPWKLPEVTGHPPGMLQDDSRDLSKWLAGKPGAKSLADEAAAGIAAQRVELLGPEPEQTFPAEVEALAVAAQEVLRLGMQCGEQWDQLAAAVYDYANLTAARERLAREDAQPEDDLIIGHSVDRGGWCVYEQMAPGEYDAIKGPFPTLEQAEEAMVAVCERLAREGAQPAAVSAHVSVPRELFEAWRGLCFGTDWNRGTAAGYHRRKIEVGMRELCSIPGEPSSFAAQPAPEPAEPVAWMDPEDMKTLDEDGWCVVRRDRCDPGADHSADAPLYAAPPAKPLTEEQIQAERSRRAHAIARGMEPGGRDFDAGVRFAERAHGISAAGGAEG